MRTPGSHAVCRTAHGLSDKQLLSRGRGLTACRQSRAEKRDLCLLASI